MKYRWVDFAGDSLAMSPDNEYCLQSEKSSGNHSTDKSNKVKFLNFHPLARVANFNNSQFENKENSLWSIPFLCPGFT